MSADNHDVLLRRQEPRVPSDVPCRPGRLPAQEHAIREILANIPDPEIPVVSVIDLGIVRGVRRDPPAVLITPTYT
ncbi:MAG TPA: hypothetical protein VFL92_10020, partial [Sphingomonas sp.]|nr:hypothetical protein [Sphingomonas sp.]